MWAERTSTSSTVTSVNWNWFSINTLQIDRLLPTHVKSSHFAMKCRKVKTLVIRWDSSERNFFQSQIPRVVLGRRPIVVLGQNSRVVFGRSTRSWQVSFRHHILRSLVLGSANKMRNVFVSGNGFTFYVLKQLNENLHVSLYSNSPECDSVLT